MKGRREGRRDGGTLNRDMAPEKEEENEFGCNIKNGEEREKWREEESKRESE